MSKLQKMVVQVPPLAQSIDPVSHPITRISIVYPNGKMQSSEFHTGECKECEFTLPCGIQPEQCVAYAEVCRVPGRVDTVIERVVIQEPESDEPESDEPESDEPESDEPESDEPESEFSRPRPEPRSRLHLPVSSLPRLRSDLSE